MPIDPNVFSKLKTFGDYAQAEEEFQMRKQLQQAQIKQAMTPDIGKLGEAAFMKKAQGMPLTPQEDAALRFLDAKQQTYSINPVTGGIDIKPSLMDRAGMPLSNGAPQQAMPQMPSARLPNAQSLPAGDENAATIFTDTPSAPVTLTPQNEWDAEFDKAMIENRNNPKAQQNLREAYNKARLIPTEDQSKAAGFADRMAQSNPSIAKYQTAGMDPKQVAKGAIPLIGNFVVSDDYQSFNQAQRDFINAQLRRESGAVISPEEFVNARKQYFPAPGDTEQVLAQKAANRDAALNAMKRSAGPSYRPYTPKSPDGAKPMLPEGAQPYGTSNGKTVYKLPNGKFIMEQ